MNSEGFERKSLLSKLRHSSGICLEGLRKLTKNINHDSRVPTDIRTKHLLSLSPGRVKNLSLLHVVQTVSGAHPAFYPTGTGGVFPPGMKLTTHLQLVLRSRKRGSIHPLSHTPSWRSA
jgi:hypothetical protein